MGHCGRSYNRQPCVAGPMHVCPAFSMLHCCQIMPAGSAGADLDAIVQQVMAQEHVAGASVLVARGDHILLHRGYGFADLGLEAPAKKRPSTMWLAPMLPFTGVAVMQQVERGRLSLDDDISKFIPEFPLQGHHVTIRQLLNHTSGIVDYHYLGDPSRRPAASLRRLTK